jgi:hypothetical protein
MDVKMARTVGVPIFDTRVLTRECPGVRCDGVHVASHFKTLTRDDTCFEGSCAIFAPGAGRSIDDRDLATESSKHGSYACSASAHLWDRLLLDFCCKHLL